MASTSAFTAPAGDSSARLSAVERTLVRRGRAWPRAITGEKPEPKFGLAGALLSHAVLVPLLPFLVRLNSQFELFSAICPKNHVRGATWESALEGIVTDTRSIGNFDVRKEKVQEMVLAWADGERL